MAYDSDSKILNVDELTTFASMLVLLGLLLDMEVLLALLVLLLAALRLGSVSFVMVGASSGLLFGGTFVSAIIFIFEGEGAKASVLLCYQVKKKQNKNNK